MTLLKKNLVANFVATIWCNVLALAAVPVMLRYLGIESFGLLGLFMALQGISMLLDLGLSTAASREFARMGGTPSPGEAGEQLLRTLEATYWTIGLVVGATLCLGAPLVADCCATSREIRPDAVAEAVQLFGIGLAARWPATLYSGVLMGMERQMLANAARIVVETLRTVGGIFILATVSPTLQAYLWWQFLVGLAGTLALASLVWRQIGGGSAFLRARFSYESLTGLAGFSSGLACISVTVMLLTQVDKLILSKLSSLESLGHYMLAWAIGNGMNQLVSPVFSAYFPRIARAVAHNDIERLSTDFHEGSQLMSLLAIPACLVLMAYSVEVLEIWTGDRRLAVAAGPATTLLVGGALMNCLMNLPYSMQLGYGWTSLALTANVVALVIIVPGLFVAIPLYGIAGAAGIWFLLNSGYVLLVTPIMHTRILPGERGPWLWADTLSPAVACSAVVLFSKLLLGEIVGWSRIELLGAVLAVYSLALGVTFLTLGRMRPKLRALLGKPSAS